MYLIKINPVIYENKDCTIYKIQIFLSLNGINNILNEINKILENLIKKSQIIEQELLNRNYKNTILF